MSTTFFLIWPLYTSMFVLALAISKDISGENKELPISSAYLNENDENSSSGELCDPSKQNACESIFAECVWSPQDMLYKCINRNRGNKRNSTRKRHTKRQQSTNPPTKFVIHGFEDSDESVGKEIMQTDKPEKREVLQTKVAQTSANRTNQSGAPTKTGDSAISRAIKEQKRRVKLAKESETGTLAIPEYSGTMTWDGKSGSSETCILKSLMAEALQDKKPFSNKEEWIASNRDQICDFKKFFHCTVEKTDKELFLQEEYDNYLEDNIPVCRCYEASMPVVKGTCYIPADFGTKSSCGDHVTAPYPIKPWAGAPILKPRCTPNSDCKESQYWFGKRCTCRYNAKWNSITHSCDNGTKNIISIALMLLSVFTGLFSKHFAL